MLQLLLKVLFFLPLNKIPKENNKTKKKFNPNPFHISVLGLRQETFPIQKNF